MVTHCKVTTKVDKKKRLASLKTIKSKKPFDTNKQRKPRGMKERFETNFKKKKKNLEAASLMVTTHAQRARTAVPRYLKQSEDVY